MIIRQMSFWPHGYVNEASQRPPQKKRRKASEKRQRTERVTVRLLPAEHTALVTAAQRAHTSVAELIRTSALQRITATEVND